MELVSSETALSATEQISRAEIDCQIATAHKFPRSMKKFKERAIEMATLMIRDAIATTAQLGCCTPKPGIQ